MSKRKQNQIEGWCIRSASGVFERTSWTPPRADLPEQSRDAVHGLREFAALVWSEIATAWGDPRDLMRTRRLTRDDYGRARDWIGALEQLVRRIILIMALTMQLSPARSRPSGWHRRRASTQTPHDATSWKLSFSTLPRDAPLPRRRIRTRPRHRPWLRTRPLARRLEALLRAIQHTRPHALRLARMLARIATRNDRANETRFLAMRDWDFHLAAGPSGRRAVQDGMVLAAPLSARELARWNATWIDLEPG
jgi:hypothetical protein